jgi:GAF domain-containing protein/ANTAR domain-containing protein
MSLDDGSTVHTDGTSGHGHGDAVLTERLIGAAVGVTMMRYALPYQSALELLTALAQYHHRTLEDVAGQIVLINPQAGDILASRQGLTPTLHEVVALRLLDLLCESTDLDQVLQAVTELAVEAIPGCDCASVTLIRDSTPVTVAASDERARTVDESQYAQTRGPCLEAALTDDVVQVDNVLVDASDQAWGAVAARAGIQASVSIPIPASADIAAALNVYTCQGHGWAQESIDAADSLAAYAGDAIILAHRLNASAPAVP